MDKLLKSQIAKELFFTFAFITFFNICIRVPLPYLNTSRLYTLSEQFGNFGFNSNFIENFSIFSLGLMPYVSAYLLVEICSLFVPFLKRHRHGDNKGRATLKAYALLLTFFLAAIQSKFIINGLEGMVLPNGDKILMITSSSQYVVIISTHVFSVFLLIFLAELISIYGIGNGISLLILSGSCSNLAEHFNRFIGYYKNGEVNAFHETLVTVTVVLLFIFVPIFLLKSSSSISLRHKSSDQNTNYFKINFCPSGRVAIGYATSLVMIPATISSFTGTWSSLNDMLMPSTLPYNILLILSVTFLSYLFAWLFLHPKIRFERLQKWGWSTVVPQELFFKKIKKILLFSNLPWTIFLYLLVLVPTILIDGLDVPFYVGGSTIFIIGVLSLDIISRLKVWRKVGDEKLFKIAEFHDVYYATMIKNHLQSEKIKFHLQGYYHRHILFFFGPYIAIDLKVPKSEIVRTKEIVSKYYDNLGLIKP